MPTMTVAEFPEEVAEFFEIHTDIFESLEPYLDSPDQLDAEYVPLKTEVVFDNIVCAVSFAYMPDQPLNVVSSPPSLHPCTFELRLDNQPALFIVYGYEVLNRMVEMTAFEKRLNVVGVVNNV